MLRVLNITKWRINIIAVKDTVYLESNLESLDDSEELSILVSLEII